MAVFEPDRARIVLRIVYDGPGRAGKTTNVEQLARIFGTRPGDELQVHPAATGRTIFFDWFSFDGGVLDGHQLQVQVVTVPGHKSLEARRAHILRGADVVVLVCDSAVSGQDSAREMLDSLREHLGKSAVHVPLLVQANKQDLPSAMLPHELGAALRLGPEVPVIGAQASAGIGVRETAVGAIRAAVRQMKQRTAREGLEALAGRAGTAEQLRVALQAIESLGAHRIAHDEVRRALSRPHADEGRVVYIRSAKLVTQLAGDGDASSRPRTPAPVPENMSERPAAAERPARPKIPVSAMFIEPTPVLEPPDIPSPPAATVRVPPPPVLAHAEAPVAAGEPFDPEEARLDPAASDDAAADDALAALAGLRHPPRIEALVPREQPPSSAASPQDADEHEPADRDPAPLDHEPEPAAAGTPALAADGALPSAPAPPDERARHEVPAGLAPDEAVPEDSPPATAPASAPVQEDGSPVPPRSGHVPEDSLLPAAGSPGPVPEDSHPPAAGSPEPVPEDSHPRTAPAADAPVPQGISPSAARAPARPVPEDGDLAPPGPLSAASASPPVPEDSSAASDPQDEASAAPEPAGDLPRPRPDLPPGHVWPVPAGRHVLERLAGAPLVPARPLGHAPSAMLYKTGGFCLRTRPEWRFDDDERGRASLREHVRRTARLGPLLPADTTVALALGDGDGDHVLWHIVPDLPALGAELRRAPGAERPRHLVRLASAYAAALRLAAREGLGLELDAHAFAEQDGPVYLGDRLGEPEPAPALLSALLRPLAGSSSAWLDALEQALPAALTRADVAALGLDRALVDAGAAPEARLRAILDRCP